MPRCPICPGASNQNAPPLGEVSRWRIDDAPIMPNGAPAPRSGSARPVLIAAGSTGGAARSSSSAYGTTARGKNSWKSFESTTWVSCDGCENTAPRSCAGSGGVR